MIALSDDSTHSPLPLYRRLASDYRSAMERGALRAGERMPSVRHLMRRHGVSLSTALQLLRQLEDEGRLEARPRVGYFVRDPQASALERPVEPDMSRPLCAPDGQQFTGINERISLLLARGRQADVRVDLGGATPSPELFDARQLQQAAQRLLRSDPLVLTLGRSMLGTHPDFQRTMARRALAAGMLVGPEEVLSTTGNSEAVTLALGAVAQPGDVVAVESPTYYGLLQVIDSMQMQALEIPCSRRTGLSIEALELALRTQPRLRAVVVVPELQMPLGTCMPDAHKARLVALCAAHRVALVEDDSYGLFSESAQAVRPLKAWDTAGGVIYCESFNKSTAPGLRQGWVTGGQWHGRLQMLKFAQSRHTQPFAQQLAAICVGSPTHQRHLQAMRVQLRRQREAMARLVARYFPLGTRLSLPPGGLCLWLELPQGISTEQLFTEALEKGIRLAPGSMFSNTGLYERCLRLPCGLPVDGTVEWACAEVGRLAHAQLGQAPRGPVPPWPAGPVAVRHA